ncbi:hypothetical protein FBU59_003510 [Linderina macrospora]|uniref:Uncharacterized protein n=1 Tax=Linderina macrospora TaxID=4868 RepID=A0ACC1J8F2_9FUNG|nr:hypothetical protein FBU59_003510 [Linderina macrospora]
MTVEHITRVVLNNYVPEGVPKPSDFGVEQVAAPTEDMLKENELLVRPLFLSCDPYMRSRINGRGGYYIEGLKPNTAVSGLGLGVVEASTSNEFGPGDYVTGGFFGWADKSIVSALAAGAVGQVVVQLAKARGLRVIGVAGSDKKVELIKSIGADVAFNYKTCGDFEQAIRQAAPEGVDIYFDNVGGEFLDATLMNMRPYGRIAACGLASQYNVTAGEGHRMENFLQIINRKLTVAGYVITDYYPTQSFEEFLAEVSDLHASGKITYKMDEVAGLENGPEALIDVFVGNNFGKRIIKV